MLRCRKKPYMCFLSGQQEHRLQHCLFWMPPHCKVSSEVYSVHWRHILSLNTGLCLEKRVFYRLVSGLHASINIHLSAQYAVPGLGTYCIKLYCNLYFIVKGANGHVYFEPNLSQFVRRFDVATTRGQGMGYSSVSNGQGMGYSSVSNGQGMGYSSVSNGQGMGYSSASNGQGMGYSSVSNGQGMGYSSVSNGQGMGYSSVSNGQGMGYSSVSNGQGMGYSSFRNGQGMGYSSASNGQGMGYSSFSNGQGMGYSSVSNGQGMGYSSVSNGQGMGYSSFSNGQGMGYSSASNGHTLDCILLSSSGPNWLKNLYFTYLVVLRALTKAGTYWESQSFYTGDTGRDILVKEKIMTIVNAAK